MNQKYIDTNKSRYPLTESEICFLHKNTVTFPSVNRQAAFAEMGYFPVTEVAQPEYNSISQFIRLELPQEVEGIYTEAYSVIDYDVDTIAERMAQVKTGLKARISLYRSEREESSVIEVNGTNVKTKKESQDRINATLSGMERHSISTIDFYSADGFVQLGYEELKDVDEALHAFVQEGYSISAQKIAEIEAITDPAVLLAYDPAF